MSMDDEVKILSSWLNLDTGEISYVVETHTGEKVSLSRSEEREHTYAGRQFVWTARTLRLIGNRVGMGFYPGAAINDIPKSKE